MLPPKLPSLFKTPKPRQFDHKPLYYDEVKEETGKRYKRITFVSTRHPSGIKSNIRLIIIIIALVALAYYIIQF